MIKDRVPFYSNTPDGMRCVPAVFRMVIRYFLDKEYSWEEIDNLTGHLAGKGTWFFPALIKLKRMGFEIVYIDPFDYQEFYQRKEVYLYQHFGSKEKGDWYIKKSDILDKVGLIPDFLKTKIWKKKVPQIKDIESFLRRDFLVGCDLNAKTLYRKEGYSPHFVLIIGFDKDNFIIHDPGLPPKEGKKVSKDLFSRAWSFDGDARSLTAFKYKSS